MFVWRKRASAPWLAANEMALDKIAGERLTIVSKPAQKNTIAEIASSNRDELEKICKGFGGVIEKLPRDWLQKFLRRQKSKPLKIGSQLIIVSSGKSNSGTLVIPATAAFGTGEHPTTVMSLCLLERLTRIWGAQTVNRPVLGARRNLPGNSVSSASCRGSQAGRLRFPEREVTLLDLGTGTGILALAAKRFGAGKVIAIDNDPIAIATAKENARRNKIERVDFTLADVRQWRFPVRIDIVTANLFGELLIQILPKLKSAQWLILSGVLRQQE